MKCVKVILFVIALISFISAAQDRCGQEYGTCDSSYCCSQFGWCGTSSDHCLKSKGCQSKYGTCKNDDDDSSSSSEIQWTNQYGTIDRESRTYAKQIWDFLYKKIGNKYGAAGMIGNIYAESRLLPKNLEKIFEQQLGMNDDEYTKAVDNGSYKHFVTDKAGYGLVQWTYKTRKSSLLQYAKDHGKSIGDLNMQLDFFWKEINEKYQDVVEVLKGAKSVEEASDVVVLKYEIPQDHSQKVLDLRAGQGKMLMTALYKK